MAVTQEQLDEFHRFASEKLSNGGGELSWRKLILLWQAALEREEVNAAIREGLADVEAGRGQPADEFEAEMRKTYNIPPEV